MKSVCHFIKSLFTSVIWWLGVAMSLLAYQIAVQTLEYKSQAQFENRTSAAHLAFEARIQSYFEVLRATRAMFHSSANVTRDGFHIYVNELNLPKSYPGISSINLAVLVPDRNKAAFESAVRADNSIDPRGYPGFSIKPADSGREHHVLTYVEPMEGNESAMGFDLASLPDAENTLVLARDSGELVSSGRLARTEGPHKITGLAMRMPLYRTGMPVNTVAERRAAYYGTIGATFNIARLMQDALDKSAIPGLRLRLHDLGRNEGQASIDSSNAERLLFDSTGGTHQSSAGVDTLTPDDLFLKKTSMKFGSRVWELEFSMPKAAMFARINPDLPMQVLIVALVGTFLVYLNFYSLSTARARAVKIAGDMTRDLRASKSDLAEAQHMAALGSWQLDPDTEVMTWSDETYRIFGTIPNGTRLEYEDFLARVEVQDRQRIREGIETSILTGTEFNTEHRITRRDGSMRWVQTITRPSYNGRNRMLRGTIMDITERRHNIEALKRSQELLRELTAHQDRIKEDERKRIAREIHDELGQTLLALRLDVSMLDTRTAKTHPKINERVRAMLHHIDATVKTVRTIINNLRPAVLDLGLSAAVEWQVSEFRRRNPIACDLILDAKDFALSDSLSTALFRILQESLTNVIRHAGATRVRIELYENGGDLVMEINDNGVGFDPGDRKKTESFGLIGIEERVLALGGEFRVESAPGEGTSLSIRIPQELRQPASPQRYNAVQSL